MCWMLVGRSNFVRGGAANAAGQGEIKKVIFKCDCVFCLNVGRLVSEGGFSCLEKYEWSL